MLLTELVGVAETTEDVTEVVDDWVGVLEVATSVPVPEAVAEVELSLSPVAVEAAAESVAVIAFVLVPGSSCR